MDKYEYKVRSEEISNLIDQEKYTEAVKIADTIDWRRVKSATMLLKIAALYRVNKRNEDSREMLLLAYERYPGNRSVVYSLCELSIESDDVVAAIEYYKQFVKLAPKDEGVYTLRYRILKAQEASLEERIEILEELKQKDYQEQWAFELARLYHRVGLTTKCVEECDDIILWFGDGPYVMSAMELKALHVPLTEAQQKKYDAMLRNAAGNYSDENYDDNYGTDGYDGQDYNDGGYDYAANADGTYENAGYGQESYPQQDYAGQGYSDENYAEQGYPSESYTEQGYPNETYPEQGYSNEGYPDETYPDAGYDDTGYGQNSYVDDGYGNLSYVDGAYPDSGYTSEFYVEQTYDENGNPVSPETYMDSGYAQDSYDSEAYDNNNYGEEPPAQTGSTTSPGSSGDMSQYNTINLQKVVAESMRELFPDDNDDVFAEDREKYNSNEESGSITGNSVTGDTRIFASVPDDSPTGRRRDNIIAFTGSIWSTDQTPETAVQTGRVAQMVTSVSETEPEPHTGAIKKVFVPGNDARRIRSAPDMDKLRDITEKSVNEEHNRMKDNDENVYHGRNLMEPEETGETPSVTGPMKLDDVLVEWERMKLNNARRHQEELKKRVMTQTGKIFANFDNSIKSGILGELEEEEARRNGSPKKDGFLEADETGDIPQQRKGPASEDEFDVEYVSGRKATEENRPDTREKYLSELGRVVAQELGGQTGDEAAPETGVAEEETGSGPEPDPNTESYKSYSDAEYYQPLEDAYPAETSGYPNEAYEGEPEQAGEYAQETDEMGIEYSEYAQETGMDDSGYTQETDMDDSVYAQEMDTQDSEYVQEMDMDENAYEREMDAQDSEYAQETDMDENAYEREMDVDDSEYAQEMDMDDSGYAQEMDTDESEYTQEMDINDSAYPQGLDTDGIRYTQEMNLDDSEYTQEMNMDEGVYTQEMDMDDSVYTQETDTEDSAYAQEFNAEEGGYTQERNAEDSRYTQKMDAYGTAQGDPNLHQRYPYNDRELDPEDAESIAEMAKEDALKTQEIKMNTADLSTLSEKIVATTKKEARGAKREEVREFTPEEQTLFENFAVTKKIKKQIVHALDHMTLAAYTGNVIITGDAGLDTVRMAKNLVKKYQASDENFSGKLAKITGEKINQRNIKDVFEKLNNGGIIIEKANGMSEEKLYEMALNLNQENLGIVVIMEDTKKEITRLLEKQAMIADYFNIRIDLMEMDNNALVAYAKNYALALEYSIDELGTLALYTRIANMQSGNHVVTKDEVRDIIDEAIWKSKKSKIKNFVDVLFARRYDNEDMIVLKERDFM